MRVYGHVSEPTEFLFLPWRAWAVRTTTVMNYDFLHNSGVRSDRLTKSASFSKKRDTVARITQLKFSIL